MYNKVVLIGNLGRDPELRETNSGKSVCNISLATSERYNGENHTEWHRITAFGKTAELCAEHLKKGSKALFEGKVKTREYEKDGEKRYITEILADRVTFMGKKDEREKESHDDGEDVPF